jgi:hypothetical protein
MREADDGIIAGSLYPTGGLAMDDEMSPMQRAERAVLDTIFPVEELSGWTIDNPRDVARAVLQAIREPSEGMIGAASRIPHARDSEIYQAMIDAALSE